jgi:hypothetical protein
MVGEREPDHCLVPSEATDQAQVLLVGLQDVRLIIEGWLDDVGGADPAPVPQAHNLLWVLAAPDCLLCAAGAENASDQCLRLGETARQMPQLG